MKMQHQEARHSTDQTSQELSKGGPTSHTTKAPRTKSRSESFAGPAGLTGKGDAACSKAHNRGKPVVVVGWDARSTAAVGRGRFAFEQHSTRVERPHEKAARRQSKPCCHLHPHTQSIRRAAAPEPQETVPQRATQRRGRERGCPRPVSELLGLGSECPPQHALRSLPLTSSLTGPEGRTRWSRHTWGM